MNLGVCYYPEHWPQSEWESDAAKMVDLGLTWVRIGEFAWSRIEPDPGQFDWSWLDRAVDVLGGAGLKVVMCTPTATPPKWLVDAHPDLLAVDAAGRPRGFGSRRHYCFSSQSYRKECSRITEAVAARYGRHPAVGAWQTDNEFGCHDTTLSYSADAAQQFRLWLSQRHQSIEALNRAWGTVFWSQEYRNFTEIEPPHLTVTEPNPSHVLDYRRFASDEVKSFNRLQTDLIRRYSPGRPITHNFMGFYTEFDHFAVGGDLDFASWDSYPLGFLEQFWFSDEEKIRYLRQGHPDVSGFHHDLYRGCGRGRFWVMEQQPGPVNWARFNPAPMPGAVRMWTWEAFAHGAETVSYFRWRQAPFGQEQMHAGLHRPDRVEDQGGYEARQVAKELSTLGPLSLATSAKAAIVFSYEADWQLHTQPQGEGFSWLRLAFEVYTGLRQLGLDVDMVPPAGDFTGYKLVICPSSPVLDEELLQSLQMSKAQVLFGPRTGSRTRQGHIPVALAPGLLQDILPFKVIRAESLRPGAGPTVQMNGQSYQARLWREVIETGLASSAQFEDGGPAWIANGRWSYLATWPTASLLRSLIKDLAAKADLPTLDLPEGVRTRTRDGVTFAFNFNRGAETAPAPANAVFVLGDRLIGPAGVSAWRT